MLFDNAGAEVALLLFTLLVPTGVAALAFMGCIRGFLTPEGTSSEVERKADRMATLPAIIMLVGLICSFFHLGHPATVFFMASGIGTSPLSNEIIAAAIAILAGAVYWIVCLVKPMPSNWHKIFGVVLCILALICAIFTGIAYSISTIPTWDTPFNWIGQICLTLLGGAALAKATLALADYPISKKASCILNICAVLGFVGIAITLMAQAAIAGTAINSASVTLASAMGDYAWVACVSIVLCLVGTALLIASSFKLKCNPKVLSICACICVIVGLAFMRIDFYGIYLSAGLTYL